MTLAADDRSGAFAERVRDVLLHLLQALLVDQRADHDPGLGAGADLESLYLLREPGGEGVIDAVLDVDAIGADAGLAGVAVFGRDRAFDRGIEVGIVEHDERRVAAELERELLDRVGGLLHERAPGLRGAGKGELAYGGVGAQLAADSARISGDDVEHAFRDAGALAELSHGERRVGRLAGGLEHPGGGRRERPPRPARGHPGSPSSARTTCAG